METQHLLDTRQAAAYLDQKPPTLELWRQQRRGPRYIRMSCRTIRYRLADLDAFLAACECDTTN